MESNVPSPYLASAGAENLLLGGEGIEGDGNTYQLAKLSRKITRVFQSWSRIKCFAK